MDGVTGRSGVRCGASSYSYTFLKFLLSLILFCFFNPLRPILPLLALHSYKGLRNPRRGHDEEQNGRGK